ncbi:hypothetical protein FO440_14595 [Mucilaginibacter corticis]|uniref:Uncharacterized protein n=1 Tax=Mucilaginibacter corticis TaxID=2597670 RepID=A0A556MME3_9SPHI|nr:hypothetical protein [Mucilaginibacter corticis]TSJ40962.1 hypothetical protein FO440_14595 [Mucilaginibacter corticis]
MRFALFFLALFVTVSCLEGAPALHPFPNYGAVILIWIIYNLLMLPRRRRIRYWRNRRNLQDRYMRAYLRNNRFE